MKESSFSARSTLSPMMVLLLEFISTALALRAQASLQFNVPYQCPDGITYIIYRCETRPKGEVCFYKAGQNGQWDSDAYTLGPQMADRVKGCSVSAPAKAPNANMQPTNPPYMREFPTVERVKAELKGADAMETAAKHMGAFWQLQEIINNLAGPRRYRNQLTPDENRMIGQYALGYQEAGQPYANYPDRPKWYKIHSLYEVDAGFLDELLNRFFSPGLRAQYLQMKGDQHARAVARSQAAAETRAQVQAGRTDSASSTPAGSGQQDAQTGLQALQQLAQGLSQIIMSAASSLPATQPVATPYATATSAEEAKEQWQNALRQADHFESSDEFVLMFFRPGYAGMMCHGGLLLGERPYTVETQNGRVVLKFPFDASTTWSLALRQDGALVSQNARTLQLFGKQEGKYEPCVVDVLTPKPRAASTAAGPKPSQPGAGTATTAEAAYASGKKYYEAKNYAQAVEAYRKAVTLKPSMAEAHDGLGLAYHGLKQYPAAVATFKEAIRLKPKDPLLLYHLADTYFAQEKRKEMLEVAKKLEPLDEELYQKVVAASVEIDPVFYKVMGEKALEKGDLTTAVKSFREALRLQPDYAEASEGLGKAYFRLKQFPDAEAALKEAVRLKPDFAEAHFGLGMTYLAMGRKEDALQVYSTLQGLDNERAQKLYSSINRMGTRPQPTRGASPSARTRSKPPQ